MGELDGDALDSLKDTCLLVGASPSPRGHIAGTSPLREHRSSLQQKVLGDLFGCNAEMLEHCPGNARFQGYLVSLPDHVQIR